MNATAVHTIETAEDANKKAVHDDMISPRFYTTDFAAMDRINIEPVRAEWYEASSDRFVIYAEASEEDVRRYAENLERFHAAMEHFTGRTLPKPSPSNRITLFAAGSTGAVGELAGTTGVAGFYLPRWQGSVGFVQSVTDVENRPDLSTTIMLHEYAHHFFASTERFAMPLWMSEGAAEFFSAAGFRADGSVVLGLTPRHRSFTVFWKEDERTPVAELLQLDWGRLGGRTAAAKDSFYGNSWLLYHFLSTDENRSGQLREYWIEVLKGTPSLDAARAVFGDIGQLQRQINSYYRDPDRLWFEVKADELATGDVTLRALGAGEVASMDARIRLERGASREEAAGLAGTLRGLAQTYPDNAAVLTVLAHAAFAAGDDGAAMAAADAALAIDDGMADAYVLKGLAGFRQARQIADPADQAASYAKAMETLDMLNARENDHTIPLVYAYRAFAERGIVPNDAAKDALVRAAELAPFDRELWLIVGMMHMNDGRIAEARAALQPLASNPHGGEKAGQVQALLGFLSDKPEGQPIPVQQAISNYFLEE